MATVSTFRQKINLLETRGARTIIILFTWTAWMWLYAPTLGYLRHIFSIEDFRTNQILLLGIVGIIGYRWYEKKQQPSELSNVSPTFPLAIIIGATALWLITERWLAINTLSATFLGIGCYGLLGLLLDQARWRKGLPAALLIIGTLPFGAHIETFLGYPLRIFTAQLVGDGLAAAGFASIGVDTILIFENGISKVDLPCSGVQSLWTGSLFFLAATWLEDKKLGIRWLIALGLFAIALIVANTLRVAVLVTVGEALGWHLAAEMLHVPLGVLGFVGACVIALSLLRYFVPTTGSTEANEQPKTNNKRSSITPATSHLAVMVLVLVSSLLYSARPISGLTAETLPLIFADQLTLTEEPLKPDEWEWLTKDGAESADRYRFEWHSEAGTRSGTMILISSRSWRAHHRPERCFEVYGLDVNDSGTHLVNTPTSANPMPIRQVNLGSPTDDVAYQAVYWFQSADTITDDYGSRLWADVTQPNTRWMLVSVLFDEGYADNDPAVQEFYLAMNESVHNNLTLRNMN
ncbi:MAG: exosortase O [Anaerolineae bacterium]